MAGSVNAANGLMQGCRGRSPRRNILIVPPFPIGEGGRGDRGKENKLKAGAAGDKEGTPSCGHLLDRLCKCRPGSAPGMQGAKPLA